MKEKKKKKGNQREKNKGRKNKNISNNHILIINKRLIRKVYQIHKTTVFSVIAFA